MRLMAHALWWFAPLTATVFTVGACGDDDGTGPPPPPPTGSVEVTTETSGESIDADGYMVTVDDGAGQAIGTDATLTVDDVEVGSRSVELGDLASNCAVSGDNPRTVNVTDDGVAATAFAVTCVDVGSVEIMTNTTGDALDADGYLVSVAGGAAEPIGLIEALTVESVASGTRSVVLTGVAANCTVAGDNPRDVPVPVDGTISTQFDVSCFAPISEQIVFYTSRDGNTEIYVMNEDGSNPVRLTNHPTIDALPTVSPDGTRIAFQSFRDGNAAEIYVMNADGSYPVNLTNHAGSDTYPAWSPDGSQVLFTSGRTGELQVYVVNADGSGVTNLSNMPGTVNAYAAWSPDGSQIAFATNRDGNAEIYVMNPDGSGQTNLTNHPGDDQFPAWSPDGTQILFQSHRDGNYEVYVMNADGSDQTNLSNDEAWESLATWSPAGTQIAFTTNRDGDHEIYVMNADGSGQTNLTNAPASSDVIGYPSGWR